MPLWRIITTHPCDKKHQANQQLVEAQASVSPLLSLLDAYASANLGQETQEMKQDGFLCRMRFKTKTSKNQLNQPSNDNDDLY